VPGVTFLLGEYSGPVEKKARERKQRDKTPSGPVETAQSVDVQQLQEQAEDKAQVARIKVLMSTLETLAKDAKDAGRPARVNLFELVLHPTSFSQTVENFFDLAFQIKEGSIKIETDAGGAYVGLNAHATTADYAEGLARSQNIIKLDYKTYRALVDKWTKGRALLPDRDGPADGGEEADAPPAQRRRTS